MANADRPPRAALYIRVSTADQNPSLQLDELRQLAQQRQWLVVNEFVDVAQSGAKDRRPELARLMKRVHRGGIDLVVCWRFDRFARSVRHLVIALEEFRARGIDFLSLQDGIDTSTPAGRFTFHVIAAVAELERELIRERTRAGLAAAKRRGKRLGRPPVQLDVTRALELRRSGLSVRRIAGELGCSVGTVHRVLQQAGVQKTSPESAAADSKILAVSDPR